MAENLTIARPYAKAVFDQALADQNLAEWQQILQILAGIVNHPEVSGLLDRPAVSDQQLLTLFKEVTLKALPKLAAARRQEVENFLNVLIMAKRLAILPQILQRYEDLVAEKQELKAVTVISAYPLNEQRRQNMITALTRRLHSKVVVDFQEDANLIGGALIRSGNWVLDDTIKSKLENLRDSFGRII